jgi:hypothetical protein
MISEVEIIIGSCLSRLFLCEDKNQVSLCCAVQHELGEMRSLLEEAEVGIAKTHSKAASIEAELNGLRCQVLTLRYQLDAVDGTIAICGDQQQQQVVIWSPLQ